MFWPDGQRDLIPVRCWPSLAMSLSVILCGEPAGPKTCLFLMLHLGLNA